MNGIMEYGDLSTRKLIDLLYIGLSHGIIHHASCFVGDRINEVYRGKINGVIRLLPHKRGKS